MPPTINGPHTNNTYITLTYPPMASLHHDRYFFAYSQGCMAGWFDEPDCFAEVITTMEKGAFAVIMNARYGWGSNNSTDGPSQRFNRYFWDGMFSSNAFELGWANQFSKEQNLPRLDEGCMRWCTYEITLFGDPALTFGGQNTLAAIHLDRLAYQSDAVMAIRVTDQNLAAAAAPVLVECFSNDFVSVFEPGTLLASNEVWLADDGSGVSLTGSVDVASLTPVAPAHGDVLRVSFVDMDSGAGLTQLVYTVAAVDDVPPVLTNLVLQSASDSTAVLAWDTDEPADSFAAAVTAVPPGPSDWQGSTTVVGAGETASAYPHTVTLTGLQSRTRYLAAVRSTDAAGNSATLPVDPAVAPAADFLGFVTRSRVTVLVDGMESGPGDWTHGGVNDVWEYGQPAYGPESAASGTNCWGTNLEGYYPNLMNAWLVSEPVWVGENPVIEFRSWYEVEAAEGGNPYVADVGFVEVNAGSGWINVTEAGFGQSAVAGTSDGWEDIRIELGTAFTGRVIQVRFRFETDATVQKAGWYLDDFRVSYSESQGVVLDAFAMPVDDSPALAAENDGDGWAEPGETVDVAVRLFNTDVRPYTSVVAVVESASDAAVVDSARDTLAFGTVPCGQIADSSSRLRITLAGDPAGFVEPVPFLVHVSAQGTAGWNREYRWRIAPRESVSGLVTNLGGAPLAGAIVTGEAPGCDTVVTTTGPDGSYVLTGLVRETPYALRVAMPGLYSPSAPRLVTGPAAGVNVGLGRAWANPAPATLSASVSQSGSTTVLLALANTNAAADLGLNVLPAGSVEGEGLRVTLEPAGPVGVAPGASTALQVRVWADAADVGVRTGAVLLAGNAIEGDPVVVPLTVEVTAGPVLDLASAVVWDSSDGDAYAEPGEEVSLALVVLNQGAGAAPAVTGVVSVVSVTGAVVTVPAVDLGFIATGGVGSDLGSRLVIDAGALPGQVVDCVVQLDAGAGGVWEFPFSLTIDSRAMVSGVVRDAVTTQGVASCTVRAEGMGVESSAVTDGSGAYRIEGLVSGVYTVTVDGVVGYGSAPARVADLAAGDAVADFALPPLDLGYAPASFAVSIEEGRTASRLLTVENRGVADVDVTLRGAGPSASPAFPAAYTPPAIDWLALRPGEADPDSVVVRFVDGTDPVARKVACAAAGGRLVRELKHTPAGLVKLAPTATGPVALGSLASALAAQSVVAYVEPHYLYPLSETENPLVQPDDSFYQQGLLWALQNNGDSGTAGADIGAPEAWQITRGSSNVVVAVCDSGISMTHWDLGSNLWTNPGETGLDTNGLDKATNGIDDDGNGYVDDVHGFDFLKDPDDPTAVPDDGNGHGTHVAGTIGAVGNNGVGVCGVNWTVRLMALKIGDDEGISAFAAAEAIEYAVDMGVRVSNHSWGGWRSAGIVHDAITYALAHNHLLVCSAGNAGTDNDAIPNFPASDVSPNVLSVAAADSDDLLADFSNYGVRSVDLAAPGVGIWSTYPGGSPQGAYRALDGTSMAAPHVTGVAGLLLALDPHATWEELRGALLDGVRPDPALVPYVATGGHLSAPGALRRLNAGWMSFERERFTVPAGGSTNVAVWFNRNQDTPAGVYEGEIVLESGVTTTNRVPVTLSVSYSPVPVPAGVRIDDAAGGDGDGYAEPGETAVLWLQLANRGSVAMPGSVGQLALAAGGGSILSGQPAWGAIDSGGIEESSVPATVTFGGTSTTAVYRLALNDGVHAAWTGLTYTVEVGVRHSISGRVTRAADGTGIGGAEVVWYGAEAGSVETDAQGWYRIDGLPSGAYTLRGQASGLGSSAWTPVGLTGPLALDLVLGSPAVVGATNVLMVTAVGGATNAVQQPVTNAGSSAWSYTVHELARRKVLVVTDAERVPALERLVASLGAEVEYAEDNALYRYTGQPGTLTEFDIVLADLSGSDGYGRRLEAGEYDALLEFVGRGGRLVVTGGSLLGSPENELTAELVGSTTVGLVPDGGPWCHLAASAVDPALNGPFCTVSNGACVAVSGRQPERALADGAGATGLLSVAGWDRVIRRRLGAGEVVYWGGNPGAADWTSPGVLQDVFKNLLYGWLAADVSWLDLSSASGNLGAGSGGMVGLSTVAPTGPAQVGTNLAAVLLIGNLPDTADVAFPVVLVVQPVMLKAAASGGVTRWDGSPLEGDGSAQSCLFQLIDAGPDGTNDPPTEGGGVTGDDRLLRTLDSQVPFGRFGAGYEAVPDMGRFSRRFGHELVAGRRVYVRAWDAPTYIQAVAYGDSALYALERVADETHDFGAWVADRLIGYPAEGVGGLRDQNGDGVPDGWSVERGLDPRQPAEPLASTLTALGTRTGLNRPSRVAVWSNFVFVADTGNNRVLALSRDLGTLRGTYSGLNSPQGLAVDAAGARVVVADTLNYRVVVLSVDPVSGSLAFAGAFGSFGSADGSFNAPMAVAVSPISRNIYVADSREPGAAGCNHRIQRFTSAGAWVGTIGAGQGPGDSQFSWPCGVAVDAQGLLYVADTGNNRVKCHAASGSFLWKTGAAGSGDGQLNAPRDVGVGWPGWLHVADTGNMRLSVFDISGAPGMVRWAASFGTPGESDGPFWFPRGVWPVPGTNEVYVADTWNDRVRRVAVAFDGDGDGMDDVWEAANGLDPSDPNDGADDADGDGVTNLGEFRARTDPANADMNDNGAADGLEMILGRDPAAPGYDLLVVRGIEPDPFRVDFNVVSGGVYRVEASTNLVGGAWNGLPGEVVGTQDGVQTWAGVPPVERPLFLRAVRMAP